MHYLLTKKTALTFLFLLTVITSGFAQLKRYTFAEAEQLSKQNPKPIVVFVHTSWCTYCKLMENSTFKNKEVVTALNTNFYFVSFDAETKEPITYQGHSFYFKPNGTNTGIHELATALATIDNQVVYPTLTILGTDQSILFQQHSVIRAKEMLSILYKANGL
ncbi:thioredoxin family protein [Flavobacterium sp.]|uniref:thioredoxin family protein n=1 Tax=Flavobacterium sp. TaxID=239 RepID=UPI002637B7C1|nr:thioredoxin family protein [Flavobacterium sp.]MDG2433742.1 thioredoxin family protein [Flavobacterium sp.]